MLDDVLGLSVEFLRKLNNIDRAQQKAFVKTGLHRDKFIPSKNYLQMKENITKQ